MENGFSGEVLGEADRPGTRLPSLGEIGLNNFAPYIMNRVVARWNANLAEELKTRDISTAKMRALAVLSVSPSLTINELSVFAVMEQSTMSRTVDALEEQGLISRTPRAGDMRVRDVAITEEGRALFDALWPTMYDGLKKMFNDIDDDEYRAFLTTLHKILRNIRKHDV
ncbi:transcriptional regulator [Rhizobium rhizosphaerae]|uniref:Transcriptional regulator n=1 Tax=Xaviernesmea rhizosphaerae TaxID=1672749 RepID=A0A1Q9ADD4_9HYPH|nr:MarR family transcriptional regulator [Xaviernesmea rhizosphaerae]OLP52927.1 transcriptional regulator [Xaviernesmea rhizosphaerae]OQP87510.1 MarR family transcriptional regulator [Xaviernesmea rhizosphaerae]